MTVHEIRVKGGYSTRGHEVRRRPEPRIPRLPSGVSRSRYFTIVADLM